MRASVRAHQGEVGPPHNAAPRRHLLTDSDACCERAQVTNPPIDPVREAVVTSLRTFVGPQTDISSAPGPEAARRLELEHPILTLEVTIESAAATSTAFNLNPSFGTSMSSQGKTHRLPRRGTWIYRGGQRPYIPLLGRALSCRRRRLSRTSLAGVGALKSWMPRSPSRRGRTALPPPLRGCGWAPHDGAWDRGASSQQPVPGHAGTTHTGTMHRAHGVSVVSWPCADGATVRAGFCRGSGGRWGSLPHDQ